MIQIVVARKRETNKPNIKEGVVHACPYGMQPAQAPWPVIYRLILSRKQNATNTTAICTQYYFHLHIPSGAYATVAVVRQ